MANYDFNCKDLSSIIADSETIEESIPNYVLLKYVLYEALKRVVEELPRKGQINPAVRSIMIFSKVRTLLNFLKYLLPIYSTHSRDIISKGKQLILSRWASSHDHYRVLRSVDEFPVTFTEVHGFYDPMYVVDRAIVMLSGPPGTKLTRWPFYSTAISMLQASKERYKTLIHGQYKRATTEEVVRYMVRELKPSCMSLAVSGTKITIKTNFYRCVFVADINFYFNSGIDFLPIELVKLQFYPIELAHNIMLISSITECIHEKLQRIRKSLELTSVKPTDTRFYLLHSIICDFISTRAASTMLTQVIIYKASNQNTAFQSKATFCKRVPNAFNIQLQDALHEIAIPSLHRSFNKHKNRLLQPCFAVIFRLTIWSHSLIEKVYELGGCMLEDIDVFYPQIDLKQMIGYSVEEDASLIAVKSFALGVGKESHQTINTILTLYKKEKRTDNYAVFFFRPVYTYPFGLVQLLSDTRIKHRKAPEFVEYIDAKVIPYYSTDSTSLSIRSQAGVFLFQFITSLHSQISSHVNTTLVDLYTHLKKILITDTFQVDATKEGLQSKISSVEIIIDAPLGLLVSISDFDSNGGLQLLFLIKGVDVTKTVQRIFSASIYSCTDAVADFMVDFIRYFFLILDLSAGNTKPYFSKLQFSELQAQQLHANRYLTLNDIDLTTVFSTPQSDTMNVMYIEKVHKALKKFNYLLRTCRFSMEIPHIQYSLFGTDIKSFKTNDDESISNLNSSLFMSIENISEQLNYYHGGYFIPTPIPHVHVAVAMWDKAVHFYDEFLKESMSVKGPITNMIIQQKAECCIFVALTYSLPNIISPSGLLSNTSSGTWAGSVIKSIPINSAYLKYLKCNPAYESDFLATYAFLNTTVTTCRVSGSAMCLSKLYGIVAHIDSLLWHRAIERILLGYNPSVVLDNNRACNECKRFRQFIQKTTSHGDIEQESELTIQLYTLLLTRSPTRTLLPYRLRIVYRTLPSSSESTFSAKGSSILNTMLIPQIRQCKACNCDLKNPCRSKVASSVELHLISYNIVPDESASDLADNVERSIAVYNGRASYSLISSALMTIAPTIYCQLFAKVMVDNLPLHIYLQHSEMALRTHNTAKFQRATEVDFRVFTRRDLALLIYNLKNYIIKARDQQFNYQSLVNYILDPDVIPVSVNFSDSTQEQRNIIIRLIALHQDFVSKRSLRRCIYSFKLPGQKVPLIPFIPSQNMFSYQGGPDHLHSHSPNQRANEQHYLNFMPGSQLKQQAKYWSGDRAASSQFLQDSMAKFPGLLLEHCYNIVEEEEVVVTFTATNLSHLVTQHSYRLDDTLSRTDNRPDGRSRPMQLWTHTVEYPGGYLNPEQLSHSLLSMQSSRTPEADHKNHTKRLFNCLFGKVYENTRILGILLRTACMPVTLIEIRQSVEVPEVYSTTDPRSIKIVTTEKEFTATTTIELIDLLKMRIGIHRETFERAWPQDHESEYQSEKSAPSCIKLIDSFSPIMVSNALHYKRIIATMAKQTQQDPLPSYTGLLHLTVRMMCHSNPSILQNGPQSFYVLFDLNPPSIYTQIIATEESASYNNIGDTVSFPETMHMWLDSLSTGTNSNMPVFSPRYLRYKLAFDAPAFRYIRECSGGVKHHVMRYYNNEVLPIISLGSLSKQFSDNFAPFFNFNLIGSISLEDQRKLATDIHMKRTLRSVIGHLDISKKSELLTLLEDFAAEKRQKIVTAKDENIPFTLTQSNGRIKSVFAKMYARLHKFLKSYYDRLPKGYASMVKAYNLILNVMCGETNASARLNPANIKLSKEQIVSNIMEIKIGPRYWLSELCYESLDKELAMYFSQKYLRINLQHLSIHSIVMLSAVNAIIYQRSLLQFMQTTFDVFSDCVLPKQIVPTTNSPYLINANNNGLLATQSVSIYYLPSSLRTMGSDGYFAPNAIGRPGEFLPLCTIFRTLQMTDIVSRRSTRLEFLSYSMLIARDRTERVVGQYPGAHQTNQQSETKLFLPIYIDKDLNSNANLRQCYRVIKYGRYIVLHLIDGKIIGKATHESKQPVQIY